jgi:hypothetical protein
MRLQDVLKRNKNKALKTKFELKPLDIANDDRPYDENVISENLIKNSQNTPGVQQEYNKGTARVQQEYNKGTTRVQQGYNKSTTRVQQEYKPGYKQEYNQGTVSTLNEDKKISFLLDRLVGTQKKIFDFLLDICITRDENSTGPISTLHIASYADSSYNTTKVMIYRLNKIGLISRLEGKRCKGGYINVEIPKSVKIVAMKTKNYGIEPGYKPGYKPGYSASSSSIYKNTTTSETENLSLGGLEEEWLEIDIKPLAKINFAQTHLFQIASEKKLTPQMVQDSIYHFAFDLEHNKKREEIKKDPVAFFMGILRKKGEPYNQPSNYESPQAKAIRLYLEDAREREQRRSRDEDEAMNLAFNDWFAQLTDAQKLEFLPAPMRQNARLGRSNKILENSARAHFKAEVWVERLAEILNDNNHGIQPDPKREEGDKEQTVE